MSILNRFYQMSKETRFLLVTGVAYLVSQTIILIILHPLGSASVLQLQTTFSPKLFLETISGWESAGLRHLYERHFYFDHLHPLWYSLFLSGLIALVIHRRQLSSRFRLLLIIPFIAGFCDVIENQFHIWFLADLSRVTNVPLSCSAFSCNLKWTLVAFILLFILIHSVRLTRKVDSGKDPLQTRK